MELRHLRYFVAVAEELHFRRAAERLYVAQPAVSEQVRKLEAELGVRLLDRTQRSVSLTVPGAALLEEARRVLRQADIAVRAAQNARERQIGRLRVGYLPDALPRSVPESLSQFRAAAPGVDVVLESGRPLQLIDDVRQGRLDVAVVCLPVPVGDLRVTPLELDRAVAAVPESGSLSREAVLQPQRIGETPLIMLPRIANPAFYDAVIGCWREAGTAAMPVEAPEPRIEHVLLAVAAGAGIGVLLESAALRHSVPGVRVLPLAPPPMCEPAIVTRDEPSTSVAAFVKLARRSEELASRAQARALDRAARQADGWRRPALAPSLVSAHAG
jgi:DNA-binding transcriptional LysR family regulator